MQPVVKRSVQGALITAAYGLVVYVTLIYCAKHDVAAMVWPASPLVIGALMRLGRRGRTIWPEAIGIGVANALAHWFVAGDAPHSAALGFANGLELLVFAILLEKVGVRPGQPSRIRAVVGLAVAVCCAALVGAVVGGPVLADVFHAGTHATLRYVWSWWLIDVVNFIVILPVFVFWPTREERLARALARRQRKASTWIARRAEFFAAWCTLAAAGALVPISGQLWLIELSASALMWFALRFGMTNTACAALTFSIAAVSAAIAGYWPELSPNDPGASLLSLQTTLALTTLPTLIVAAIASQREHARRTLHADASRLSYALEGANDGLWDWDLVTNSTFFSLRACRMFGRTPDEFPDVAPWALLLHPEDVRAAEAAFDAHARGATEFYEAEIRCRHKDGRWIWILDRGKVVERDAAGRARRAVGTYTDISDRKRLEAQLEHLATHDALTGLANIAVFNREIEKAGARLDRLGGQLAVMLIDVDHFKSVNDTMGHAAGDALLTAIATRMRQTVRAGDVAARLGGDEFAVIASGQTAAEFDALAERMNEALSAPVPLKDRVIHPSVSIGVAIAQNGQPIGDELVIRADRALYQAKSAGRGTWRFFQGPSEKVA